MATKKKDDVLRITLWTPALRLSYPNLSAPDTGRQFSDNKYKTDGLIYKSDFKLKGKALEDAVREVGKAFFGDKYKIKGGIWHSPFKDTDTDEKINNDAMKDCILIRAKASGGGTSNKPPKQPWFIGPRKGKDGKFPLLSKDEVAALKGGDWGALNITVFPYDTSKDSKGVSIGLNGFQFWKTGEGFGQGSTEAMQSAEEFDEDTDAPVEGDVPEVDEEDNDSVI